jgi:hypothetical protein
VLLKKRQTDISNSDTTQENAKAGGGVLRRAWNAMDEMYKLGVDDVSGSND